MQYRYNRYRRGTSEARTYLHKLVSLGLLNGILQNSCFSEKYWRVTESFLKRAKEYGMNCVLTPLFTPPLDTQIGKERPTVQLVDVKVIGNNQYAFGFEKLDSWLSMCDRCGIEYYEMSHLFTQWGAKHAPKLWRK